MSLYLSLCLCLCLYFLRPCLTYTLLRILLSFWLEGSLRPDGSVSAHLWAQEKLARVDGWTDGRRFYKRSSRTWKLKIPKTWTQQRNKTNRASKLSILTTGSELSQSLIDLFQELLLPLSFFSPSIPLQDIQRQIELRPSGIINLLWKIYERLC